MRRIVSTMVTFVSSLLVARSALADGLVIETLEHGQWASSIAAMQTDLKSEGKTIHVRVNDERGHALECGFYDLTLDPDGARAFSKEPCDPASGTTPLTLTSRSALFDHEDGMSHPRRVDVLATRVVSATVGGGAHVQAESAVTCTAEVRPYLPNLETGAKAALTPDRYKLTVYDDQVRVIHDGTHWTLTRPAGGTLVAAYDVLDEHTGAIVMRDKVALACGNTGSSADVTGTDSTATTTYVATTDPHETPPDEDATPHVEKKAWQGQAWTMNGAAGMALLRPAGLRLQNTTGIVDESVFGLGNDVPAASTGVAFTYERPWLYASIAGSAAFATQQGRTLFEWGAAGTLGTSLQAGIVTFYAGPTVGLSTYQLTGPGDAKLEWGSVPELGVSATGGMRIHIRGEGSTMAVLGFEVSAPIAGHQPMFACVTLGWGGGR